MVEEPLRIQRPERWDNPFSRKLTSKDVDHILGIEPFLRMDANTFPKSVGLRSLIANDTRFAHYKRGNIIVRAGDYGNSAFLLLSGTAKVIIRPGLSASILGRAQTKKKSFFNLMAQLLPKKHYPEMRLFNKSEKTATKLVVETDADEEIRVSIPDMETVFEHQQTSLLEPGALFGEMAALSRIPRKVSIIALENVTLLEIRWQGVRDLRRFDATFRNKIDNLYQENCLTSYIHELNLFKDVNEKSLQAIEAQTTFERYGTWDWQSAFGNLSNQTMQERLEQEPIIVNEGDYVDGLILIGSGFVRISKRFNHGHVTIGFLGPQRHYGLPDIYNNWLFPVKRRPFPFTLRALGYVDILRVPAYVIEQNLIPSLSQEQKKACVRTHQTDDIGSFHKAMTGLLEFFVEHRFINGTSAMLIDLDRCTRCDECVRACSYGHNLNPRFIRHGKRYGSYMIANSCMHCVDPICMIGCPTGAIYRNPHGGQVLINEAACIGCSICASSCVYENIRMVDICDEHGDAVLDNNDGLPILRATKCDLCFDQWYGPLCERACPENALLRMNMQDSRRFYAWSRL